MILDGEMDLQDLQEKQIQTGIAVNSDYESFMENLVIFSRQDQPMVSHILDLSKKDLQDRLKKGRGRGRGKKWMPSQINN